MKDKEAEQTIPFKHQSLYTELGTTEQNQFLLVNSDQFFETLSIQKKKKRPTCGFVWLEKTYNF